MENVMLTLSVSIESVLKRVYAEEALRAYMAQNREELPLLTEDRRGELAGRVVDAFSLLMLDLMPAPQRCVIPADPLTEDVMEVDLLVGLAGENALSVLREGAEAVLAMRVLEGIHPEYGDKAEAALATMRAALLPPPGHVRLTAWW